MSEIHITPDLELVLCGQGAGDSKLRLAFGRSPADGILELARELRPMAGSESLSYFAELGAGFMRAFCVFSETQTSEIPPDPGLLERLTSSFPPMPGAEHIDLKFLETIWAEMSELILYQRASFDGDGRSFLSVEYSHWADVGKIFFHLAETRGEQDGPFAFLATYSVRVSGKARIQHRPLGLALKDAIAKSQTKVLENLLRPINEAANQSEFIFDLLSSKQIYRKASLSPEQAYQFLASIPGCESAGIVCKVPVEWQSGRPPRAKVDVTIGGAKPKSHVGFNQLVQFDARIAIGNENLSKKELEELLAAEGPLVDFQGKWVEIDRLRIQRMLDVWAKAVDATHFSGGEITFAQAMRALSGFDGKNNPLAEQLGESEGSLDSNESWLRISAAPEFKEQINRLRSVETRQDSDTILSRYLLGQLRPYQQRGVAWLSSVSELGFGGCLADDMGLGKTIQIIGFLLIQKYRFESQTASSTESQDRANLPPSLLVVPASLVGNWQSELDRFAPSIRMYADLGPGVERIDLSELDVVITTYGKVRRNTWFQDINWSAVIADEAQALKNANTKQSKAMRSLQGATKIAMTGTPVENNLTDLWSIFDFSCPGLLGSQAAFGRSIEMLQESSDYGPLRQLIAPYLLRRQKTDKTVISDLPDKIEMNAQCFLSKKQVGLYEKEVKDLEKSLASEQGIGKKGAVLRALIKFKQICNHPSQYQGNDSYAAEDSGKFEQLKILCEVIASKQEKVLVFTQFRELTDILAHYLSGFFGRSGLVLHGGTPVKRRQKLVEEFSEPGGPPFFILSLKAGGTGLNLTAANHVIHFDRWWNPAVENQATDRAFRIGQSKKVLVHKFVTKGTVEEKIDLMIRSKQGLSDAVISAKNEVAITEMSDDELLDMVRLDIRSIEGGTSKGLQRQPTKVGAAMQRPKNSSQSRQNHSAAKGINNERSL